MKLDRNFIKKSSLVSISMRTNIACRTNRQQNIKEIIFKFQEKKFTRNLTFQCYRALDFIIQEFRGDIFIRRMNIKNNSNRGRRRKRRRRRRGSSRKRCKMKRVIAPSQYLSIIYGYRGVVRCLRCLRSRHKTHTWNRHSNQTDDSRESEWFLRKEYSC